MTDPRTLGRDLLRRELADRIFDVFAESGFAEVTVEEAARAGGISRATFFRYFGSKEEVVVAALQRPGDAIPDLVRALPALPGETAWQLLRRAHEPVAEHAEAHRLRLSARVRMIMEHDSLQMHFAGSHAAREALLASALEPRMQHPAEAPAIAAAMLALLDLTWRTWATDGTQTFAAQLDSAMSAALGGGALRP